nr:hypothetical protein [Beihai hepe-like virus 4]
MDFEKYYPKPFVPGQSHRTVLQYDQFKAFRSWHISSVSIASIINLIIGFTVLAALANLEIFIDVENDGVISKLDELKVEVSDNADRAHLDSGDLLKQLKLMVTSLASANNKLDSILVSVNQNRDSNVASAAAAAVIESTILLVHQQLSNMLQMYGANTARDDIFHSKVLTGIDSITANTGDSAGQATIISNLEEIKASTAASLAELTTLNGFQAVIAEEVTDVNVALVGIGASVGTLVVLQQTTGIRIREHSVTIRDQPILVNVEKFFPVISTRPASGHEWPVKPGSETEWSSHVNNVVPVSPAANSEWNTNVANTVYTAPVSAAVWNVNPASAAYWYTKPELNTVAVHPDTGSKWYVAPSVNSVWLSNNTDCSDTVTISGVIDTNPIITAPIETNPIVTTPIVTIASPADDTLWNSIPDLAGTVVNTKPDIGEVTVTTNNTEILYVNVVNTVDTAPLTTVRVTPEDNSEWQSYITNDVVYTAPTSAAVWEVNPASATYWNTKPDLNTVAVKPDTGTVWYVKPTVNTLWPSNNTKCPEIVSISGTVDTIPQLDLPIPTVASPAIDAIWNSVPNLDNIIVATKPDIGEVTVITNNTEVLYVNVVNTVDTVPLTTVRVTPDEGSEWDSHITNNIIYTAPNSAAVWNVNPASAASWHTKPDLDTVAVRPSTGTVWYVAPKIDSVWLSNNTECDSEITISGAIKTMPADGSVWDTNPTLPPTIQTMATPSSSSNWDTTPTLGTIVVAPSAGSVWLSNSSSSNVVFPEVLKTTPVDGAIWHTSVDNEVAARVETIVTVTPELGSKWEVVQGSDFLVRPDSSTMWPVYPITGTVWLSNNTVTEGTISVDGIVYTSPASDAVWSTDPMLPSIFNTMPTIPNPLDVEVAGTVSTVPDIDSIGTITVEPASGQLWGVTINDTDGPLYTKPDLSPSVSVEIISPVEVLPANEATFDVVITDSATVIGTKPDLTPFVSVEIIGTVDTVPSLTSPVEVEPSSSAFWLTQAVPADGWDWSVKPAVQTVWQSSPVTVVNTKPQLTSPVEVEPSNSAFWLTQAIPADGWDWSVKPAVQTVWQSSPVTVVNTKPQFADPLPVIDSAVVGKLDAIECTVTDINLGDNATITVRQDYNVPWYVEQEPNDFWSIRQIPGDVWAVQETPTTVESVQANKYEL